MHNLSAVNARKELLSALTAFYRSDLLLRPAQEEALIRRDILGQSGNVIIAAPTNSGKSLISYLLLFGAAMEGQAAVLAEPLRALAYEKAEELRRIADILRSQSKISVKVLVTTGDYRLTNEFMHSGPAGKKASAHGRIIVATPERLDALSRVPGNREWFQRIRLICFDEAHLLGDPRRGAALELLITYLKTLRSGPRLALMSATISNPAELAAWLAPCRVISDIPRYPTLDKWVYCPDGDEDIHALLLAEITDVLKSPGNSVLIFVYQTASAELLAHDVAERISGLAIQEHDLDSLMSVGAAWFHSKMSAAAKARVLDAARAGSVRVIVSTTALSMGVNLPATHVFVRDTAFAGAGRLEISDLLQMLGRAGRGDRKGTGIVWLNGKNPARESSVVRGLSAESLPELRSRLIPPVREGFCGTAREELSYLDRVGSQLMGVIGRFDAVTPRDLKAFWSNTFAGDAFDMLPVVLQRLSDWKLAYRNEDTNEYALTHLGKVSSRCYLPPLTAANIGQLFRDLLKDRPDGAHIAQFSAIDFLIVLCVTSDEIKAPLKFSKETAAKIHIYMNGLPFDEASYLYRMWIERSPETLYGSARVDGVPAEAERRIFQGAFTAMLLYDISRGCSSARLEQDYKIDVEELQEKLRDNAIWILCGLARLLETKSFYYHLKETCRAGFGQIRSADSALARSSRMIFSLIENLKYRSDLGELIRGIRRAYPNAASCPGKGTVRKLEKAGMTKMRFLTGKTVEDLLQYGICQEYAKMIVGYVQTRAPRGGTLL